MEMLHFKELGIHKVLPQMQLGVYLVIDNFVYVPSDAFNTLVSNSKAIRWL